MASISMSDLPDDEQRGALSARLGADGLDLIIGRVERGETIDGATAQRAKRGPVTALPRASLSSATTSARDVRVRGRQGERWVDVAGGARDVDDHVATVEEIIAAQDARQGGVAGDPDQVSGGTYDGIADVARGRRVAGRRRNDPVGTAKPRGGKSHDQLHEELLRDNAQDARAGRPRPAFVGGRVAHDSKDALDADATASNGEVMDMVAIVMQRTGRSKREVVEALGRWAETGMLEPDIADAVDAKIKTIVA